MNANVSVGTDLVAITIIAVVAVIVVVILLFYIAWRGFGCFRTGISSGDISTVRKTNQKGKRKRKEKVFKRQTTQSRTESDISGFSYRINFNPFYDTRRSFQERAPSVYSHNLLPLPGEPQARSYTPRVVTKMPEKIAKQEPLLTSRSTPILPGSYKRMDSGCFSV